MRLSLIMPDQLRFFRTIAATTAVFLCSFVVAGMHGPAFAAASITSISTNGSSYPNSQVPKYEKFEVTFQVAGSSAQNLFYPYTATLPPGMNGATDSGISVTGFFTSPSGQVYQQPGFYYQGFDEKLVGNSQWFYPNSADAWKVRFAPDKPGTWQFYLKVQDSSGATQSPPQSFTVSDSGNKGFIRVSPTDSRYFEYGDGTYFPATGYNQALDHINPNANIPEFQAMNANGILLMRAWLMQHSIFGSAWGLWYSHNPAFQTQEPIILFSHPNDVRIAKYPGLTAPPSVPGHDVYLWLNFDTTTAAGGGQWSFNPCQMLGWEARAAKVPLERNTTYRVRARYNAQQLEGPKVAGKPYGFAIKNGGWLWNSTDETKRCYDPSQGTVLAASYAGPTWTNTPDPQNPGWTIVEGTFNSANQDFIDYLYLTFDNVESKDGDPKAGHIFVDDIRIEEALGNGQFGPNVVYKPTMGMHTYINQRDALALDKNVELAHQNNVYIKGVINEKNDFILQSLNFDGSMTATKDPNNFFGNGRETGGKTKVRFLQEAWWRYAQARWGYSPNIHSWELLNEGPDGYVNHHIMTDEFGKYMHCRVFGIDPGSDCNYDHPNDHMITTSTSNGKFPILFWKNASGSYPDVDYADKHLYAFEGTQANLSDQSPYFNDEAAFSKEQSLSLLANQIGKPIIRGETGWQFEKGTDWFGQNATNGLWLHNFLWAGLNSGGLIEHYWNGPPTQDHIDKMIGQNTYSHNHRPEYLKYSSFISNIPLSNGKYVDAAASNTGGGADLRVWGQKDTTNGRAHLWIQNANHTWKNVKDAVSVSPINATVTIGGFTPNKPYKTEWWNTYTGQVASTQTVTSDGAGTLALTVTGLKDDVAVKIGDYGTSGSPPPSPPVSPPPPTCTPSIGDLDSSGKVTSLDLSALIGFYGNGAGSLGDLNCDSSVNNTDITILLGNLQ